MLSILEESIEQLKINYSDPDPFNLTESKPIPATNFFAEKQRT